MSINAKQREKTARELQELCNNLTVSPAWITRKLGYANEQYLHEVLAIAPGVDPAEVWRVRDFLCAVAAKEGVRVPRFSVLKSSMRSTAKMWFGNWEVPAVD
ncbi:DUF2316 family protein [Gleimia hominis]|uniref:DUF2316 family protein n=1 Tax=Gleimia hominis TaxID=595468 RepID=A0ABU3IBW0_9ACTO|nr:DUF2316 family protein [Gleimia hominis]MDT3766957.1 DUF2316 family protein [Gleimia hominis]